MESTLCYEQMAEAGGYKLDQRVHINVHSRLRRPVDPDGISPKACIDGIVQGHLLPNDTAKVIKGLSFTQEIGEPEETIIDIVWE